MFCCPYLLWCSYIRTPHPLKIDQTVTDKPCSLAPLQSALPHQTMYCDEGLRKLTCVLSDDGDENDVCDVDDNLGNVCGYGFDVVVHHLELQNQNTETEFLLKVFPLKVILEVCCSLDSKMNADLILQFSRYVRGYDFILLQLT